MTRFFKRRPSTRDLLKLNVGVLLEIKDELVAIRRRFEEEEKLRKDYLVLKNRLAETIIRDRENPPPVNENDLRY